MGAGNKSGQLLMPATDTPGTNEYGQANVNKCVLFVVLCESGPMHLAEPTFARVPTAERKTCFRGELQWHRNVDPWRIKWPSSALQLTTGGPSENSAGRAKA